MLQFHSRRIRIPLDQAITVLDIFAESTPCWAADVPVTKAAALIAAQLKDNAGELILKGQTILKKCG